jgi:hypothetical protein
MDIAWSVFVLEEQYQDFEHNTWRHDLRLQEARRDVPDYLEQWAKELSAWEGTCLGRGERHV